MAIYYWASSLFFCVVCTCSETSFASDYQLEIYSFWIRDGDLCALPLSVLGSHRTYPMQVLCILPQSVWVHMCISPAMSRRHGFLGIFHPHWLLQYFLLLNPEGERFDGDIPLGLCSKVSHSLHIVQLWLSVFVPINFRSKLPCWWLSKEQICEWSRMLL